jgi:hypothetical protein
MSFYIAAHIVFDKSELKSVDIVDENHDFTTDTLKTTIDGLKTDFYIKIMVEKCDGPSNDCFGLSNGTYYRLNFDKVVVNGTLVNGDFLKMSNQIQGNQIQGNQIQGNQIQGNQTQSNQTQSNQTQSNQTPNNKQNSIKEFNKLIVKALQTEKSVSIEKFKQLIVDALSIKSGSEAKTEENPVVTQEKKLETNPQINDGKTYFIKSTKKPGLSP